MDNNNNNNNNYFQNQVPPQGNQQGAPQGQNQGQPYPPQYNAPVMPNQYAEAPAEINKWNWGAFMFSFIWGIGNKAYLTLLCLVPCLNIVWIFVSGAMGNKWAWKSGEFKDVEQFMAVQRTWNRAGLVYFIIAIAVTILSIVVSLALGLTFAQMISDLSSSGYSTF